MDLAPSSCPWRINPLSPEIEQQMRDIRGQLRTRMDGIVSTYMRTNGANYSMNWGLTLPHIKEIATSFTPSIPLAMELYHSQVRELRILSTLLLPPEKLSFPMIDYLVEHTNNTEMIRMLAFNLLSRKEASPTAINWAIKELSHIYTQEQEQRWAVACHVLCRSMLWNTYPTYQDLLQNVFAMLCNPVEESPQMDPQQLLLKESFLSSLELIKRFSRNQLYYETIQSSIEKQIALYPSSSWLKEIRQTTTFEYETNKPL
ncbi:MAG: hypothetical protein SPI35_02365 [Porphyromonas sp.]|nr:hypothetical protein [Porphyromonas sp.]